MMTYEWSSYQQRHLISSFIPTMQLLLFVLTTLTVTVKHVPQDIILYL